MKVGDVLIVLAGPETSAEIGRLIDDYLEEDEG